jgi:hypothetical protein
MGVKWYCFVFTPKGWEHSAQGNALGIDGRVCGLVTLKG